VEEQALYRAILDAPHDDTPRLVYADWLDENADRLPEPLARWERSRAEFIRLQCKLSRIGVAGWKAPRPYGVSIPAAAAKREKRLLLTQAPKWRREYPLWLASSPFDRGFPRPFRSLRPAEFLVGHHTELGGPRAFPPLRPDLPARRYLVDDSFLSLCPLWDVHLYALDFNPGEFRLEAPELGIVAHDLLELGQSPAMARVGWLQLSFARTPAAEFLRTGNFPNVETLVLNCGPFPEVLEAVAANESFRSLRYVRFGPDRWAWDREGSLPNRVRSASLMVRLEDANIKHMPYGEMRTVLRKIVADPSAMSLPPENPPAPPLSPPPLRLYRRVLVARSPHSPNPALGYDAVFAWCLTFLGVIVALVALLETPAKPKSSPPLPEFKVPDLQPIKPEVLEAVDQLNKISHEPPGK
jgi:uncharacterized protein (TIGR02996 family)